MTKNNQMKVSFSIMKLILFILPVVCFFSCYPGGSFFDEDLDIVVTLYDEDHDFGSISTFALVDTVVDIGDRLINLKGEFDDQIINKVRSNLLELGYVEETNPEENAPDVVVLLSKVSSTNIDAYSVYPLWWGYWGWYPGWPVYGYPIGPGWSPYYPWGGGSVVYTYTTGTLFVDMLDPEAAMVSEMGVPTVWTVAINGLIDGSDSQISSRIDTNIDQAFDQSPYLSN